MIDRIKRFLSGVSGHDIGLGAAGLSFGLVSLSYPFGRDQGLFFYTSREWILRGRVPYRDVFDHKGPFIYVIHALTIGLLGENCWGMRLVELGLVPLVAYLGARLAAPRGQPLRPGMFGAAWLGTAVFHYGFLNFWDTGQCEIWYAAFTLASIAIVLRAPTLPWAKLAAAGALSGFALLIKPPAIWFVLVAVGALLVRLRSQGDRPLRRFVAPLAAYAAGAAAAGALVLGYFAATHALAPMIDILVGANGHYVAHERGVGGPFDVMLATVWAFRWLNPLSTAFLVLTGAACFLGIARNDRRLVVRYMLPWALVAASFAAVAMQLKFYPYHWGNLVAACAVFAPTLYADSAEAVASKARSWTLTPAWAAFLLFLFALSGDAFAGWGESNLRTLRLLTGRITREQYAAAFDLPFMRYYYGEAERVGFWLRDRLRPTDTIAVRGFEPEIYAICHSHYTGRFYWTTFLTDPRRAYRREEWVAEDVGELTRHPPRFVVTLSVVHEGLESAEWFEARGYTPVLTGEALTVLEREGSSAKNP